MSQKQLLIIMLTGLYCYNISGMLPHALQQDQEVDQQLDRMLLNVRALKRAQMRVGRNLDEQNELLDEQQKLKDRIRLSTDHVRTQQLREEYQDNQQRINELNGRMANYTAGINPQVPQPMANVRPSITVNRLDNAIPVLPSNEPQQAEIKSDNNWRNIIRNNVKYICFAALLIGSLGYAAKILFQDKQEQKEDEKVDKSNF